MSIGFVKLTSGEIYHRISEQEVIMKCIFKIVTAFLMFSAIPFSVSAQETEVPEESPVSEVPVEESVAQPAATARATTLEDSAFDMKNAFGVFAMLTYNSYYAGLEYERWFDMHGFSVGGFVMSFENSGLFDILGQYRYSIVQDEYGKNYAHRFYAYGKLGMFGDFEGAYGVNSGAGIGYEMLFGKRLMYTVSYGLSLGYGKDLGFTYDEFTVMPDFGSSFKFRW